VALQVPSLTVTLNVCVEPGATEIVCEVAPVDHRYDAKPGPASSVIDGSPAHIEVGPVIVTLIAGETVTVCESVAWQVFASVTVTLNVCVDAGETMIVCVVAPVDHRYDAKPAPASRVTEPPVHIDVGPVMVTVGSGFTVTVWESTFVQPRLSVTVTL
jgi:ferredoxin-like protein FixX